MSAVNLTIVVPTYNRAPLLKFLLESIVADFPVWPSDLELVVLDNASTDETSEVLSDLREKHSALQTRSNARNIGMDANLAACFSAGTGRYLWQIGDDELLYRGAASWVLDMCRQQDFGLLHLGHDNFGPGEQINQRRHRIAAPVIQHLSSAEIVRKANIFLTFISANVVNRYNVLQRWPNFDPLSETGTELPQLSWIYSALLATDRHLLTRTPIFGALNGNNGGYRLFEVFAVNLRKITERRLGPTLPKSARIVTNASLMKLLAGQLTARVTPASAGRFATEDVQHAMNRAFHDHFYYRKLVRHILAEAPVRRRVASFMVRLVNRVDRATGHRLL